MDRLKDIYSGILLEDINDRPFVVERDRGFLRNDLGQILLKNYCDTTKAEILASSWITVKSDICKEVAHKLKGPEMDIEIRYLPDIFGKCIPGYQYWIYFTFWYSNATPSSSTLASTTGFEDDARGALKLLIKDYIYPFKKSLENKHNLRIDI